MDVSSFIGRNVSMGYRFGLVGKPAIEDFRGYCGRIIIITIIIISSSDGHHHAGSNRQAAPR